MEELPWKPVRVSRPETQWVAAFFVVFLFPNVTINFHMEEWTLPEREGETVFLRALGIRGSLGDLWVDSSYNWFNAVP